MSPTPATGVAQAAFGVDLINLQAIKPLEQVLSGHYNGDRSRVELLSSTSTYTITSVNPVLIDNDDVVTVSFYASHPQPWDWVGAFTPPDADISLTAPFKFGNCSGNHSTSYLHTGIGSLNFNITNLRDGIRFYYFTGGYDSPILVANTTLSQVVQFRNPNEPLRNRVVPTGDPNKFTMLWNSYNSTAPTLKWGTQQGLYPNVIEAISYSIAKSELCGGPAVARGWHDPGLIHAANMTGMIDQQLDNQLLYYIFGDAATMDFSEEKWFLVPPRSGTQPPTRSTRVAVFGDLGVGSTDSSYDTDVWNEACPPAVNTTQGVSALVYEQSIDAILHTGDISYANGFMTSWDFFLDMITPMAGSVLYITTMGNHESDWPNTASLPYFYGSASGGECSVASQKYLPLPAPAVTNKPWFAYDIGIIHFLAMSTEHNYTIGSEQYLFLEQDLQSVNRSRTPWVIFTGHRPFYVDSNDCCATYGDESCGTCLLGSDVSDMQQLQENIEPLLFKYQVNLGFTGHFHDMQRQSAVYQNQTVQAAEMVNYEGNTVAWHENPKATVWMVVGSAGNGPSFVSKQYEWSERYWDNTWGFAVITALNATMLQWDLVNSATNEIIDRMVLTQNFESWTPVTPSDTDGHSATGLFGLSPAGGITLLVFIVLIVIGVLLGGGYALHRYRLRYRQETERNKLMSGTELSTP